MEMGAEQVAKRVLRLQIVTLVWMAVEAVIALAAAWHARSPALLGFGGDSAVELLSAAVVYWRFLPSEGGEQREGKAAKIAGSLLFLLAAVVAASAVMALAGHLQVRPSRLGIALLMVAAVFMPWLAAKKLRLAALTGSAALKADAAESKVCGYLAVIALAGLVVNAVWNLPWADPVAGLALLPLILREGWEAVEG
jgi:divalent metal cation (Fe/Co/Zn/Cd) transporter